MRTVSARDANQQFSTLLAAAERGETIVITKRGKPVARLGPSVSDEGSDATSQLLAVFRELRRPGTVAPLDRDALHER